MLKNTIQSKINILWVCIGLLVIILLHTSMFIIAQPLSSGYIDNYYQQNIGDLTHHEASDDRFDIQWPDQLYLHTDNDIILHAKTFYNQAIDITSSRVHFYRPDDAEQDVDTELLPLEDGRYMTTINFSSPGLWHMHMLVSYQGQQHLLDHEFVVVRQPLSLPQRTYSLGPKKEKKAELWSEFFIRVLLGRSKEAS